LSIAGVARRSKSFFADLQAFLLKGDTQARIAATGRRVELAAPRRSRPIDHPISTRAARLRWLDTGAAGHSKALSLYRKRCATFADALCIRRVRSMKGHGEEQLLERLHSTCCDAGPHPRGAGAKVEARTGSSCLAVQRSRAVDGNR